MKESDVDSAIDVDSVVLEALGCAKKGLTKDSLAAVLALQIEIDYDQSLIDLLNDGKIEAKYTGDKSAEGETLKPEDFIFSKTVKQAGKEGQ